jgi:DNA mismatch endonuclease (patch repair protein)
MSANRAKDSKPELLLRMLLWHSGLRGYRLHYKKVPGRPDISFVSKKLAIFVHGCFWHRCPKCAYTLPKTNSAFWQAKFDRNVARDQKKVKDLKHLGWKVATVWECDLASNPAKVLRRISILLS